MHPDHVIFDIYDFHHHVLALDHHHDPGDDDDMAVDDYKQCACGDHNRPGVHHHIDGCRHDHHDRSNDINDTILNIYVNDEWAIDLDLAPHDIDAVRVDYDGRTYHLVDDDALTDHEWSGFVAATGINDDAASDDLDRLRNDFIDAQARYLAAPDDLRSAPASIAACLALVAALPAAGNPVTG